MSGENVLNGQMSETRRQILIALKQRGKMTADELAQHLDISAVAVRRQLANLERDRLVEHEQVKRPIGRPGYVYHLSEPARLLFPSSYHHLAAQMLRTIKGMFGQEAVDMIFQERRCEMERIYSARIDGNSLRERLARFAELRTEEGYMATWEEKEDGSFVLHQHHCPIIWVAEYCGPACREEAVMISELLGADVVRHSHQTNGDATCSYEIRPRTA